MPESIGCYLPWEVSAIPSSELQPAQHWWQVLSSVHSLMLMLHTGQCIQFACKAVHLGCIPGSTEGPAAKSQHVSAQKKGLVAD